MVAEPIPRPVEVEELLERVQATPPRASTACGHWTAHDLGAHVAAGAEEVVRHLRAYREGQPLGRTRGLEEREAPFRELAPDRLVRSMDDRERQLRSEVASILAVEPDAVLAWTGRQVRVDALLTHLRSECAVHRWDLVGDDDTSRELLGSFDLLEHAVTAVGSGPLTARGVAAGATVGAPRSSRIRSEGHPDLVVTVGPVVSLELAAPVGEPTLVADQAVRLLVCWGRTPQPPSRIEVVGRPDDARRVRQLLSGY